MRKVWGRALPFGAALLLVSACGGPSTGSSSSPSPSPSPVHYASIDPCSLITADQASAAVGSPVTNLSTQVGVTIPGVCFYGDTSGKNVGVYIYAQTYPDATTADQVQPSQLATALGGQLSGASVHTVTGIGDKAVEYSATSAQGGGEAIFVFQGNAVIMIIIGPTTDTSKVEQLARTAVGNLKPG